VEPRSDSARADHLHECRHTYASFLMAAGYTLKEIMEYMGHSNLAMVQRYVRLLPPQRRPTGPSGAPNLQRPRQDSNLGPAD
jgi:integrase